MNDNQGYRKKNSPNVKQRKLTALVIAVSGIIMLLVLLYLLHDKIPTYRPEGNSINTLQSINQNQVEYDSSECSSINTLQPTNQDQAEQNSYADDWQLILVNRWNPIPADYKVELTELANGHAVDSRIYPELQKMFDDARAEGIMPTITSSYRTNDDQQQIMDEKISEYQLEGYSYNDAKELAEKCVAIPGTSEHQIGMAVDISTQNSDIQSASTVWEWLGQNSYKYGFILRYPENKTEITGVIYEPWHFRYVGKETAKEIKQQDICLEEYLNQIYGGI